MALELVTICENCGEQYYSILLPSDIINNEVKTCCPKCGFENIDIIYD